MSPILHINYPSYDGYSASVCAYIYIYIYIGSTEESPLGYPSEEYHRRHQDLILGGLRGGEVHGIWAYCTSLYIVQLQYMVFATGSNMILATVQLKIGSAYFYIQTSSRNIIKQKRIKDETYYHIFLARSRSKVYSIISLWL